MQVSEFFDSAFCLQKSPKIGRIVPEFGDKNVRELIIGFYRIIYRIKSINEIDILTVHHSKRLLTKRKFKKRK